MKCRVIVDATVSAAPTAAIALTPTQKAATQSLENVTVNQAGKVRNSSMRCNRVKSQLPMTLECQHKFHVGALS